MTRARQRTRGHPRALNSPLQPQVGEVGIDALDVSLGGTWRSSDPAAYRVELGRLTPGFEWLRQAESSPHNLEIQSRSPAACTLNSLHLRLRGFSGRNGTFTVKAKCNPTRTLAHLLADYPDVPDFTETIFELSPMDFFGLARNSVHRSLDGGDNWIEDVDQARACLGNDPFGNFLPIFIRQLYALIVMIGSPDQSIPPRYDGQDIVATTSNDEFRLKCENVTISRVEAYFERVHARASHVVRMAAQRVLAGLDAADVTQHIPRNVGEWAGYERRLSRLSFVTELSKGRKLAVYEKVPGRIRLEVRRNGAGRYDRHVPTSPVARLQHCLETERRIALRQPNWTAVADDLTETDLPEMGDLLELFTEVSAACARHQVDVLPVMSELLRDGGIVRTNGDAPSQALIQDLTARGVLKRMSYRGRDRRGHQHRFVLKGGWLPVQLAVLAALSPAEG